MPCKNQNVGETKLNNVINALRARFIFLVYIIIDFFPFFPISLKAAYHGNAMNNIIQSDNEQQRQQQQQEQQQQSDQQQVFTQAEVEQTVHELENSRLQR